MKRTQILTTAVAVLACFTLSLAQAKDKKQADFEALQKQVEKNLKTTGKSFKLPMATLSHWTKDGNFDEEYLFWDNQTYMNQLGLGK